MTDKEGHEALLRKMTECKEELVERQCFEEAAQIRDAVDTYRTYLLRQAHNGATEGATNLRIAQIANIDELYECVLKTADKGGYWHPDLSPAAAALVEKIREDAKCLKD